MASETIARLTQQFRTNRTRFEAFCRSLSDEELERPVPNSTYRVKDFATHLATIGPEIVRWFEAVRGGQPDQPAAADGSPWDVDKFNDAVVAERRGDWSLDQIFHEAEENRKALLESLQTLDYEKIEKVVRFNGDNKRPPADIPFKLFLFGNARHDLIHIADMLKALPERASDPEMQAWPDDPAVKWYQDAMAGPPKR